MRYGSGEHERNAAPDESRPVRPPGVRRSTSGGANIFNRRGDNRVPTLRRATAADRDACGRGGQEPSNGSRNRPGRVERGDRATAGTSGETDGSGAPSPRFPTIRDRCSISSRPIPSPRTPATAPTPPTGPGSTDRRRSTVTDRIPTNRAPADGLSHRDRAAAARPLDGRSSHSPEEEAATERTDADTGAGGSGASGIGTGSIGIVGSIVERLARALGRQRRTGVADAYDADAHGRSRRSTPARELSNASATG